MVSKNAPYRHVPKPTEQEKGMWLYKWALEGMTVKDIAVRYGRHHMEVSKYIKEVTGIENVIDHPFR